MKIEDGIPNWNVDKKEVDHKAIPEMFKDISISDLKAIRDELYEVMNKDEEEPHESSVANWIKLWSAANYEFYFRLAKFKKQIDDKGMVL